MDQHLISIIEIADAHGRRRQSIHKLVNRLGIKTIKRKSDQARGQAISYITADDYEELRGLLNGMDNSDSEAPSEGSGVFYIVQLEPQYDPGRFKVGFTTDIGERLRSHRTSAPFSKIIRK